MSLVILDSITKYIGDEPLLDNISLTIGEETRLGLVGVNGSGKTTLFNIIAGEATPDAGKLFVRRDTKISYLHQEEEISGTEPLIEAILGSLGELSFLREKLRHIESGAALEEDVSLTIERFRALDGFRIESKAKEVLTGLGLSDELQKMPVNLLSGGEKNRAAIAKAILMKPDLLLMDEPTNYLDMDGVDWLAEFLKGVGVPYIVVSHDRYFLDRIAEGILNLEGGKLSLYGGNYSAFEETHKKELEARGKSYRLQQAFIRKQEEFIRKNLGTQTTKQAEYRRRFLKNMKRIPPPPEEKFFRFIFLDSPRGGDDVIVAKELTKCYGKKKVFEHFSTIVKRGKRYAVVGPNGAGKTTLFKIITGEEKPTDGMVRLGAGVTVGYFAQETQFTGIKETAFDMVRKLRPSLTDGEIRTFLGAFGFRGESVFRKVSSFSGGEKSRLALIQLLLLKHNLLLLDEPTSHLDITSRISLERALKNYNGTILFISHDKYFLKNLAEGVFEIENGNITFFDGDFNLYLLRKRGRTPDFQPGKKEIAKPRAKPVKKHLGKFTEKRLHQELQKLEESIETLEEELLKIDTLLSRGFVARSKERKMLLLQEREDKSRLLEEKMWRWEEIYSSLESISRE